MMKASIHFLLALGAALLASCSSLTGPGGGPEESRAKQPWGITGSYLASEASMDDEGTSASLVRALDESTTVGLEYGGFDSGPVEYTYTRLEYRQWYSPGERLEPYVGAGLSLYNYETTGFFGDPISRDYLALSLVAGVGYWLTTNISIDAGVVFDPLTFEDSDEGESAYEDIMVRLGLSFWL